jgi:hypothetical protein
LSGEDLKKINNSSSVFPLYLALRNSNDNIIWS